MVNDVMGCTVSPIKTVISEEIINKINEAASDFWTTEVSWAFDFESETITDYIGEETCAWLLNNAGIEWTQELDDLMTEALWDKYEMEKDFYLQFKEEAEDMIDELFNDFADDYDYKVNGDFGESTEYGGYMIYSLPKIDLEQLKINVVEELNDCASGSDWGMYCYDYEKMVAEKFDDFTTIISEKFEKFFPGSEVTVEIGYNWTNLNVAC